VANGFSIRRLTAQDELFLWEMLYQAIHVPAGQTPPPRGIVKESNLAHYVREWGQGAGDLGFAAVEEATGQPVGAAWLRLFSGEDPGYGYVDDATPELSIALLPDYRGKGLGSELLDALLAAAMEQFAAVSLSVSADNAAKGLYQRLGFTVVEEDGSSLVMVKLLK
jgi:ribosomal protein S18 acetylase RimI-like enzyme